jgi:CrcB protein
MIIKLLYVFAGGGAGALLRYLISGTIQKNSPGIFPYGTLVVNFIGALLIGFLWETFQNITISDNIRVFLFIGLLGAFTTFATFSLETLNLIKEREYIQALVNVVVSNITCLILVFIGSGIARFALTFFSNKEL